jgi:membrane associated rhomboid family serine protease
VSSFRDGFRLPGNVHIGPPQTPRWLWYLIAALGIAFLGEAVLTQAQPFGEKIGQPRVLLWFGLQPERVFSGWLWQPLTWMFVHADLRHLLGNLFFLWMFGSSVAEVLGRNRFLVPLLLGFPTLSWLPWGVPAVGASGAIFAVVTVYGLLFPDREINLLFVPISFPSKLIIPLIFLSEFSGTAGGVSHGAHVAGVVVALLWWRFFYRRRQAPPKRRLRVVREDPGLFH